MDPHGGQPVTQAGVPLGQSPAVVIMVHGRNAGPENILDLASALDRPGFTYLAPAAAGRTWYPFSFMADIEKNEPGLTSALVTLAALVAKVESHGVPRSRIVMLGFSQGACLTSEFAVRNAGRFGGFVLFTGGLIGPPGTAWNYPGSFDGTPIFQGSSDPDPHVPPSRVEESAAIYASMGARVTTRIYPGMGHTINEDEIAHARAILDDVWAGSPSSSTPSHR
jgi:phospholipase/carboxylesterase